MIDRIDTLLELLNKAYNENSVKVYNAILTDLNAEIRKYAVSNEQPIHLVFDPYTGKYDIFVPY